MTKLMTALLVVDSTPRRRTTRVPVAVLRARGSLVAGLPVGRRVAVDDPLHAMLIVSGDDAAVALAHPVAGLRPRSCGA